MASDKNTMFNLKLRASIRKKFKNAAHYNGTTMQAVLAAFVESYIESPGKFRIKMEVKGMQPKGLRRLNMTVKPVEHDVVKMKNIEVRRVMGNDGPTGEFHIKPLNGVTPDTVLARIQGALMGAEAGIADKSGELGLDYPVYLIVSDEMQKEVMLDVLERLDLSVVS
jgi:hypothetical protein